MAILHTRTYTPVIVYCYMGWGGNRRSRDLEWIKSTQYEGLSKRETELLKKFRSTLRYRTDHSDTIEKLRGQIKSRQEKITEYDENLTYLFHELTPLVQKYYFSISFTSFTKGVNNTRYYNLIINRPGRPPKSIGLGNKNTMKQHLRNYCPKDEDKINKNVEGYVNGIVNTGEVYDRIRKMITPLSPTQYSKLKLSRDKVFPIK